MSELSELSELFTNAMRKQSLFQSLYNKYSRRNAYSDVYSKVFVSWVFGYASELLNINASLDLFLSACDSLCILMDLKRALVLIS